VYFYGAVGKGGHGRQLIENLQENGINADGVFISDKPTSLAAIFVNHEDGTHRVVVSKGANLDAKQDRIEDHFLSSETTLVLQGELSMDENLKLLRRVKSVGGRTIMNLAPYAPVTEEILCLLDYIILNEYEADSLGAQFNIDTKNKMHFAQAVYEKFNLNCIVTLGGNGSLCVGHGMQYSIPVLPITPVDTIGAGDAFTGYFAASLDQGFSLDIALQRGAIAGSLACTKIGAQAAVPTPQEVADHLEKISVDSLSLAA
jgi:ribokinase